jgi:hypothetical protein
VGKWQDGPGKCDPAAADRNGATVELQKGWSPVMLKVVDGADAHVLCVRFAGEGIRFSIKRE